MSAPFLLEIGVEELPVSFLHQALDRLAPLANELLESHRLGIGERPGKAFGTPRRLVYYVESLDRSQRDLAELVMGPPRSVALDAEGRPTKAGVGFAKKQGADPSALEVLDTDKGQYVAVQRREQGRPAADVLASLIPDLCRRIPFPKSMRWADVESAFGRPIHWIVALHGTDVVHTEFAGIRSGRTTRGHRFLAPAPFDLADAGTYFERLRAAHVIVSVDERKAEMERALDAGSREMNTTLVDDPFLLDECASLVEWPFVVPGGFDPEFLSLPASLIVSVLRDHQRYFALRPATAPTAASRGDVSKTEPQSAPPLAPGYLNVVNTALDPAGIQRGNDRVLAARLADARFFVHEDQKRSLAARVPMLDRVVFQNKLGSVGAKARRVAALVPALVPEMLVEPAARAATLAKADLVTLIVGEFPELQGEMGRFYALRDGEDSQVADAIRDHYLPKGASDGLPTDAVGAAVAIADRVDTLVGCFGIGLTPSGSNDPFALRRAAMGILRIARAGLLAEIDLRALVRASYDSYPPGTLADRTKVVDELDSFFRARLRAHLTEQYPGDLVTACLGAWGGASVRDLDARLAAVAAFRELPAYEALATAFKRAYNIAHEAPAGDVDPSLLEAGPEAALAERFEALGPRIEAAAERGDYGAALTIVAEHLREPIDRFFENVFVMVDDEAVRSNRLRLLGGIARSLTAIAHFHELST
jgi:glycyl-tRNA synthetase beta chain